LPDFLLGRSPQPFNHACAPAFAHFGVAHKWTRIREGEPRITRRDYAAAKIIGRFCETPIDVPQAGVRHGERPYNFVIRASTFLRLPAVASAKAGHSPAAPYSDEGGWFKEL
jgi:hypothetical protein